MATILNNLVGIYGPFLAILFSAYNLSCRCKNPEACKKIDGLLKKGQGQSYTTQNGSITSNATGTVQKEEPITTQASLTKPNNEVLKIEKIDHHKKLKPQATETAQENLKPIFTLKDISVQAGADQSSIVEVDRITEGYKIKTIEVRKIKNDIVVSTPYKKSFGLDYLKDQAIPFAGLPFTLSTNSALKPGFYELEIKIGKTGKGSQKTKQSLKCTIHVIKSEEKREDNKKMGREVDNKKQSKSYPAKESTETFCNPIDQDNLLIKEKIDSSGSKEANPVE